MENKKMSFAVDTSSITLRDIMDRQFLELSMRAISTVDPNLNMTHFTKKSLYKALPTFKNKPILGFFQNGDFGTHNGTERHDSSTGIDYWKADERILGLIRSEDKVEVVEDPNVKGLYWIQLTCALWTQYAYEQIKRLFDDALKHQQDGKGAKSISVEVDITDYDDTRPDKVLEIKDFILNGITILGSQYGMAVTPAIQGAAVFIDDVSTKGLYAKQAPALQMAYAKLDSQQKEGKSGMKIKLDKSKEAMSDKPWGSVDKTALRNKVVSADNAGAVVHSIYLQVGKGWEDAPSQDLKYPVMEVKEDGTAVYNRGGLAAAKGYAEKNGEKAVLSKVDAIYKKLGLDEKKENESYCGDAGFAKLCDMCKEAPEAYSKFDGECEPDEPDDEDDGKKAAQCAAQKPEEKAKELEKGDPKKPDEGKKPEDPKKPKESKSAAGEPKPGEGTPDPSDSLKMKEKKMSADELGEEEHKPDPVSDIADLISDYGWRGDNLVRTIDHYKKAEDVPGKEYVIAVLEKFKAINDACLAEAAELLKKAAEGFTDDDMEFAKRCAEKCSCGKDLKECDQLSAKCAELEKKCADGDAKCAELEKKCAASDEKCAAAEKCSKELSEKCAVYEKKELCGQAKELLAACTDLPEKDAKSILAACESGELKNLEDVKNKAARLSFDARLSATGNTLAMHLNDPAHFDFHEPTAEAGDGDDMWKQIHKTSEKYAKKK